MFFSVLFVFCFLSFSSPSFPYPFFVAFSFPLLSPFSLSPLPPPKVPCLPLFLPALLLLLPSPIPSLSPSTPLYCPSFPLLLFLLLMSLAFLCFSLFYFSSSFPFDLFTHPLVPSGFKRDELSTW
jgi:hypothetical protein